MKFGLFGWQYIHCISNNSYAHYNGWYVLYNDHWSYIHRNRCENERMQVRVSVPNQILSQKHMPRVRIELPTFRFLFGQLGLWDWRAAYCATEAVAFYLRLGSAVSRANIFVKYNCISKTIKWPYVHYWSKRLLSWSTAATWHRPRYMKPHWIVRFSWSRVAQWKRAGPITQRSVDRNYALLSTFFIQKDVWLVKLMDFERIWYGREIYMYFVMYFGNI